MTHAYYVKHHAALVRRLEKAGVLNPRRVFWRMTPNNRPEFRGVQIRTMRELARRLEGK